MGGEQDGGEGQRPARQPLPPEAPPPGADADGAETEWWRESAPAPAAPDSRPKDDDVDQDVDQAQGEGDGAPEREWWRGPDVRAELQDAWTEHGQEGLLAAHEIGAQIGEAISAHLPNPYAAAQRRGLDLRWLRLGLNIPALVLSLLVTWGGQSIEGRMTHYVETEGVLAPLGWVLLPVLLLLIVRVLPFGSALGSSVGGLVSWAAHGLLTGVRRAWGTPYIGYVLRLIVAVAAWSFAIAVARLLGHIVINWLTGV